jgi:CheY-like chemotaxis protein
MSRPAKDAGAIKWNVYGMPGENETMDGKNMPPVEAAYGILVADDSEEDRFFLRKALRGHPHFFIVAEVEDGDQVVSYLSGTGEFGNRKKYPFPDVLLLDLGMPCRTGFEILAWLQTNRLYNLLVVILSGSCLPEDANKSLELGAKAFFKKDASQNEQAAVLQRIESLLATKYRIP